MTMRHIYIILLMALVCSPAKLYADKEISYLSLIKISQKGIEKQGRNVRLEMTVDYSEAKIRTQHTVALIPVIVSEDGSREMTFPPVILDGKARHNVYKRAQRLESVETPPYHDDNAQTIIRRSRKEYQYDYSADVPYRRWMLDGRLEIREEVHGCVNCGKGESDQDLINGILPAYIPAYRLDTIAPEPEPLKVRAETRTARLQFRQDSYIIRPEYKGNRAELDTITNSIELVKQNKDLEIIGVYITGYASPEASIPYNLKLSENRAKALAEYIHTNDGISSELLHVDWKGEDWDGFVKALGDFDNLLKRDEVFELIGKYPDEHDYCELQIQKLVPHTIYHRLLTELYPALRRNECRIEYNVRNFNLEEARRMINERPELLSLQEMYKVAGSYEKGSPEYNNAMTVALKYYPSSPAALNSNASDAVEARDYDKAVTLLEESDVTGTSAGLLTTLGVAYTGLGEYDKAEEVFEKAVNLGSETARHNLEEVRKVIDQL